VLWLLHDYVTEVGTMNFFVFWKNEHGVDELITPPLDGTILPGITRDTILTLMRELGEFEVNVRSFKVQELNKAIKENRVYEAFGAGTAAIVSPVQSYLHDGTTYKIPIDEETQAGKLTTRILGIM
jgi:branched-chain amino acid aminotransferase